MSSETLPLTATDIHQDNSSRMPLTPGCESPFLLFIEASVVTIFCASGLTLVIGHESFYSRNALLTHFYTISGVSITALVFGVCAATSRKRLCIRFWRAVFHTPFLLAMYFRWTDRHQVPLHFYLGAAYVHATIDCIYHNMTLAAAGENDKAGLILAHIIYNWIKRKISRIRASRRRHRHRHQRADLSGLALHDLGRFIIQREQGQLNSPNEERKALLSDDFVV